MANPTNTSRPRPPEDAAATAGPGLPVWLIESRTVVEHHRLDGFTETWDVYIHQVGTGVLRRYTVHARGRTTGAEVPSHHLNKNDDLMEVYVLKTLAQARDRGGSLATVLRRTMDEYDWRAAS